MFEKRLTFQEGSADKFWEIAADGKNFTVTFGRTGTVGQSQKKSFPTPDKCLAEAEKLVQQKLKKGYCEAGTPAKAASPRAPKEEAAGAPDRWSRTRNFVSTKSDANRFWTIQLKGTQLTTVSGKHREYREPKTTQKPFPNREKCEREAEKLVSEKLRDKYVEVELFFENVPPYVLQQVQDAAKTKQDTLSVALNGSVELSRYLCTFSHLKELKLKEAREVPAELGQLSQLEDLDIEESPQLKQIPAEIGKLAKLRRLEIQATGVEALPDEIGNLGALENLRISDNKKLKAIPAAVGRLSSLKEIYIQGNTDESGGRELKIPAEMYNLAKLAELQLPSNGLRTLPPGIDKLRALTELDVNFNKLSELPEGLFELENLETLELHYNQIKQLPADLCRLESLTRLEIEGCPIKNVPEEILHEGREAIFRFLGNTKSELKSAPLVNADPAIVARYQERIDKFFRAAKSHAYKETTRASLEAIIAFITGKTNEVPPAKSDDPYYFGDLMEVFAPFSEWTFVDRRILAFITQEAWSLKKGGSGFHKAFYAWLNQQIVERDRADLAAKVFSELETAGIAPGVALTESLKKLHPCLMRADGQPSSYGKYVLSLLPAQGDAIAAVAKESSGVAASMVNLALEHAEASFEKYLPELIAIDEYDGADGKQHIPYGVLDILCKKRPAQFEAVTVKLIDQIDCKSCIAELGRILLECYGTKYRDRVLGIVRSTLAYISERRNANLQQRYNFHFSLGERYQDATPQYLEWALQTYGKQTKDFVFAYVENTKTIDLDVTRAVVKHLGQDAVDIAAEALNMAINGNEMAAHFRQLFSILRDLDYSKYQDKVWEIARSEFKEVRQTACLALSKLNAEGVVPQAQALLVSAIAHEREAGATILSLIGTDACLASLRSLLDVEKNDDVRDIAVEALFRGEKPCTLPEALARVARTEARGKLERPVAKWLDEKSLPKLKWQNGTALKPEQIRYLLYRQSRPNQIAADPEAASVFALIDREQSGDFALQLLQLLLKNGGAKAPNRFALATVGFLGDDRIVEPLRQVAIDSSSENACATLGLHRSLESARALNRIMQVFRTKYPNVRSAAKAAFDDIATSLGMTPFALTDRMCPDFGFVDRRLALPVGKEVFQGLIGSDRKLQILDAKGQPLKSLPKAAPKAVQDEVKELAAQIKDAATQQANNLENYLVVQRQWSRADWEKFFLVNPVAFALAQNFVWTARRADRIRFTFTVRGDSTLVDAQGKGVKLGDEKLSLAHPLELAEADRAAWRTALQGAGIEPPCAQIDRPVFTVEAGDGDKTQSFKFEDVSLFGATFKSRAEGRAWRRGAVVDAGEVSSYRKAFDHHQIEAFVRLRGLGVQQGEEDVTLKDFFFVRAGSLVTGSYTYDEPRNERDERLIKSRDVPAIVYSETVADLSAITNTQKDDA